MEDKPKRVRKKPQRRKKKCTGHKSETGEPCEKWAVNDWDVCRSHGKGGGRPVVNGLHSDRFKGRMKVRYENALTHPKLLDLADSVASLDALAASMQERLDEGDTPEFRKRAVVLVDAMIEARGAPDGEAGKRFQELVTFLRAGADELDAESVLFERLERVAKHRIEANKVLVSKENAFTIKDLTDVLAALTSALRTHADAAVAARVEADWERALGAVAGSVALRN